MNNHAVAPVPSYTSQAQRLVVLTALNQEMLSAAEDRRWDGLAELEEQRARLLEELFTDSFYVLDDAALIPALTQTFAVNQRITGMLEGAQRACQGELAELSLGRRAQQAYGENSGG